LRPSVWALSFLDKNGPKPRSLLLWKFPLFHGEPNYVPPCSPLALVLAPFFPEHCHRIFAELCGFRRVSSLGSFGLGPFSIKTTFFYYLLFPSPLGDFFFFFSQPVVFEYSPRSPPRSIEIPTLLRRRPPPNDVRIGSIRPDVPLSPIRSRPFGSFARSESSTQSSFYRQGSPFPAEFYLQRDPNLSKRSPFLPTL